LKPYEETWHSIDDGMCVGLVPESLHGCRLHNATEDEAVAKLAACGPEMARMLLAYEFNEYETCEYCYAERGDEHRDDCAWLILMRKAGLR
jgi:hypothetical protein